MIIIGHRGARGEAPENTLPAFVHAYRLGIRDFELDVRLSADGQPVVIHDADLTRTTGVHATVADMSTTQLAVLDARANTPGWPEATGIPTLERVLRACADSRSWQLEIKSDQPARIAVLVRALATLVRQLNLENRATLTSLDVDVLRIAGREAAHLTCGLVAETAAPDPVEMAMELGCGLLVSNWRITSEALVEKSHRAGLPVSVWTVNDLMIAERMANIGADSIITDFPAAMLRHFELRSQRSAPPEISE